MITENVVSRTFHIRFGDDTGTAFAIDHKGRRYLVTSRHVVEGVETGDAIAMWRDETWQDFEAVVVGIRNGDNDVAVISCPMSLGFRLPLEASADQLGYGQQVYFVGFPFGWDSRSESANFDFPMPFVKSGIVSAIWCDYPVHIFVDAHSNKGFCGGPLVFAEYD
ncbi:MAG: serine protease, partial [Chloroflexi bacterium]|nr:serine protease [Chloroflexota bacterium]